MYKGIAILYLILLIYFKYHQNQLWECNRAISLLHKIYYVPLYALYEFINYTNIYLMCSVHSGDTAVTQIASRPCLHGACHVVGEP